MIETSTLFLPYNMPIKLPFIELLESSLRKASFSIAFESTLSWIFFS